MDDFGVFGFANVVGDDAPEAIFTSGEDVLLIDPSDNSLAWALSVSIPSQFPVLLLAAIDFTGDDKKELLILRLHTNQLMVWTDQRP